MTTERPTTIPDAIDHGLRGRGPVQRAKRLVRQLLPDPVYARIRQRRVARLVSRYPAWDHTGNYGGHELTIHIADGLAEGWYGHDWSAPEIAMLRNLGVLRPGACVYDLGAHQGVVALMLAREVGPTGQVLAVEAEPHNARVAEQNMRVNAADNVIVIHAAIGDVDGTLRFAEGLNGSVATFKAGTVEVPSCTVDTLTTTHRPPDLVFMDIEGYEGRALPFALHTIAAGATFFVEVHVETLVGGSPEDLVALFDGRDLYVGRETTSDSCAFVRYVGGPLPDRRFFLIAV